MVFDEVGRRPLPVAPKPGDVVPEATIESLQAGIRRRDQEISILVRLLDEAEAGASEAARRGYEEGDRRDSIVSERLADQFNRVIGVLLDTLSRWMGGWLARRVVKRLLIKSGCFDPVWYLKQYPDVRESGRDPFKHYIRQGLRQRRSPSAALRFISLNR